MFSFPYVDPDLGHWYIIGKVNTTKRRLNLKLHCTLCPTGWEFHAKPTFFFNIFSGDPHFDAKIIGLCLICLVMGPLEKEHFKVILEAPRERWGISVTRGQINILVMISCLGILSVGGNYVWCHVIVVISLELEEARRWVRDLKSSYRDIFYGGIDPFAQPLKTNF